MLKPCKVVLLTGGSSGIGAATAEILCRAGMVVYAGSRHISEDISSSESSPKNTPLSSAGKIIPVKMDINQAEDVRAVVDRIIREQQCLDAVVCNAGNGMAGAIEETSEEEAKYQFETCFFGSLKTIQACLPVFRQQGYGRIITISSVAAVIPIPYQAFYSSVKSAILIFTKALSLETKAFGVQCCSVLPGDTKTGFTQSRKYAQRAKEEDSPYYKKMSASVAKMEKDEQNGMSPDVIGKAILKQLHRKRMSVMVIPRLDYKLFGLLSRILPNRLILKIVGLLY